MLESKTVLITGAGRGIGRATALAFAAEGCRVACVARTMEQVETTARLVTEAGGEALALEGDVACEESVARFTAEAVWRRTWSAHNGRTGSRRCSWGPRMWLGAPCMWRSSRPARPLTCCPSAAGPPRRCELPRPPAPAVVALERARG